MDVRGCVSGKRDVRGRRDGEEWRRGWGRREEGMGKRGCGDKREESEQRITGCSAMTKKCSLQAAAL